METKCHTKSESWVQETPLGWALVGSTCSTNQDSSLNKTVLKTSLTHEHLEIKNNVFIKPSILELNFFKENADDDQPGKSILDKKFIEMMDNNVVVDAEGSVEAPVHLKCEDDLPFNRTAVFHRTKSTLQRLRSRESDLSDCMASMEKSLKLGFVEKVTVWDVNAYP